MADIDLTKTQVEGIVGSVLERLIGGGRTKGGSELLPPEWQANMKKLFAGELDVGERGRLMFDIGMLQLLTHQADLNSASVAAVHTTGLQHAVANWGGVEARGMARDRIWNPDEVARATTGAGSQSQALGAFIVAEVMRALREAKEE